MHRMHADDNEYEYDYDHDDNDIDDDDDTNDEAGSSKLEVRNWKQTPGT